MIGQAGLQGSKCVGMGGTFWLEAPGQHNGSALPPGYPPDMFSCGGDSFGLGWFVPENDTFRGWVPPKTATAATAADVGVGVGVGVGVTAAVGSGETPFRGGTDSGPANGWFGVGSFPDDTVTAGKRVMNVGWHTGCGTHSSLSIVRDVRLVSSPLL